MSENAPDGAGHNFEFHPAPPALNPYLNSLYFLKTGDKAVEEMLPAYSGQLILPGKATGKIDFGSGLESAPAGGFFVGPLTSARPFAIEANALAVGASFTFHGWAALTAAPVTKTGDRFLTLEAVLGDTAAERLKALGAELDSPDLDREALLAAISDCLEDQISPLPEAHAQLIETTYTWLSSSLNPPTAALFEKLEQSDRQAQRLVKRFFGLPPARLKRRYRAIRAATLLSDPKLSEATQGAILGAFYDQAHMIREIREFTGRTPRGISLQRETMVSDTLGPGGYGMPELFAGEEERQLGQKGTPKD